MTPYDQIKRDYPEIPIDSVIDLAKRDKWIRNQRKEALAKIGFMLCFAIVTFVIIGAVAIAFGWTI